MSQRKSFFKLGEKVQINFPNVGEKIFVVEAFTEDELALAGPETKLSSINNFPAKEVVFASSTIFDGKRITKGDKVKLTNKEGKVIDVYIAYILNKDSLIVSKNKEPSFSSLKWLLKLMSNF